MPAPTGRARGLATWGSWCCCVSGGSDASGTREGLPSRWEGCRQLRRGRSGERRPGLVWLTPRPQQEGGEVTEALNIHLTTMSWAGHRGPGHRGEQMGAFGSAQAERGTRPGRGQQEEGS